MVRENFTPKCGRQLSEKATAASVLLAPRKTTAEIALAFTAQEGAGRACGGAMSAFAPPLGVKRTSAVTYKRPTRTARWKLSARLSSYYAETISKWITTKRDGRACIAFESLLALCSSIHCLGQEYFKIVDVEVNVNWCPMSFISTNIVSSLGRYGPR
jgi:hypothetical protein